MIKKQNLGMGAVIALLLVGLLQAPSLAGEANETVLTVEQAIELAMQHNLKRKLAAAEVRIADEKAAQAKTGYLPKASLSGGVSRLSEVPDIVELGRKLAALNNGLYKWAQYAYANNPSPITYALANNLKYNEGPDDGLTYYGLNLRIEQPLYTGGKLTALNEQAGANLEYSQTNLKTMEQDLVFEVKKGYYTVLQTQQMLVTMEEAVKSMEDHVKEAKAYFKAGMVPQLDVMRAEVKLADLKQKQLMIRNGLDLAQVYFNFILGVDQEQRYRFQDNVEYTPFAQDLAACQLTALQNRTELKAVQAKVTMAEKAVQIVRSGKKPLVALVAEGERLSSEPFEDDPDYSLSLVASYQLIDGGQLKHRIDEAQEGVRQAQTAREWVTRGIKLEVEQAFRNLQNAFETIEVSKKVLSQAQETVRMAEVSYKAGLSTSLERLDAETGLTQAKTNYNQAVSNYQIALAQLERAIGITKEAQS